MTDTIATIAPSVTAPALIVPQVAPVSAPVTPTPVTPSVEAPMVPEVKSDTTVLGEALAKPVEALAPVVTPAETSPIPTQVPPLAQSPQVQEIKEGQSVDPAPPIYEAFKLPENVKLDDGRITEFTKLLSDLEVKGKTEHTLIQEFGQKAVDFYIAEVQRAVEDNNKLQQTSWDRQKNEWKEKFLKDPEIGGERFQTTVDSALTFLRTHGGNVEQQKEFRDLMETTGLGNHPVMIRLLANAGRSMREGTPLYATKPAPTTAKSRVATLYGSLQ